MMTFRQRLYALSFAAEVGPFMTLYALWFADRGMSVDQVSLLFAVWAFCSLAAEVPTGVLSDWLDRRWVLAGGLVLRTAGIVVFLLVPTMAGFAVGAALWATQLAMHSGTWEALVYEGLADGEDDDVYEAVMARSGQFGQGGMALGAGVAAAAMGVGVSLEALGWLTVALTVPAVWLVTGLPARAKAGPAEVDTPGFVAGILGGVGRLIATRSLLVTAALSAALESVFVLDEYVPALAVAVDTPRTLIPLAVLTLWLGLVAGGEWVARRPGMPAWQLSSALVAAAVIGGFGLWSQHPAGVCLLAIPCAAMNAAWISLDARLQVGLDDASRATVGSVRSFAASLGNMAVYGVFAMLALGADPTWGLVACMVGVLVVAVALAGVRTWPVPLEGSAG